MSYLIALYFYHKLFYGSVNYCMRKWLGNCTRRTQKHVITYTNPTLVHSLPLVRVQLIPTQLNISGSVSTTVPLFNPMLFHAIWV